nr:putative reverse transcriptase domain-containing protein [Tanacetum cinerariifolium]
GKNSGKTLIIPMKELQLDDKLNFVEEPVEIMDREIKQLKRSRIPIVKVRWNSKRGLEFTWEREDEIRIKLSSFSESKDTFMSLQALTNLHDLFSGFMIYFWSRELNISNFGPTNRVNMKSLTINEMSKKLQDTHDKQLSLYKVPCDVGYIFYIMGGFQGWAYAFHQDKASSVRVPVANVTLFSSAHLL